MPGRYPGRYRPFRAGSAEVCTCSAGADDDEDSALVISGATATPTTVKCGTSLASGPVGEEVLTVFHRAGAAIRAVATRPVPMKELV